jgi:ATP-independent RNA helicase DbpA
MGKLGSAEAKDSFGSLGLSQALNQVVKELGFDKTTPIQAQSIPVLLKGKDLVGQSRTGSGKTAAFTLPILDKLDLRDRSIQAVVLCPTRELCTQVAREIRKLGRRHAGLQVLILSGGQPMYPQLTALEKGVHLVVGTPGRVLDHIRRRKLDLSRVTTLVLDEADRMLDMGFQEDMELILDGMPKARQTAFFSATFPESIEKMSRTYQREPVRITIDEPEQSQADIRQVYYEVEPEDKVKALLWQLEQNHAESAIVFCNLKATVIELAQALTEAGLSSAALHGDLEQAERDRVMAKFRNLSTRVLIATDVAARGIDIADLDVVCNFDLPKPDIYVHRIGRTGRAGKKGLAIAFVTSSQKSRIPLIEKFTGIKIQEKKLTSLAHLEDKKFDNGSAKMDTLYISGGRKDKVRPGDILGALTGEAGGLKGADIGKIEIHDRFSYVAIPRQISEMVLQRLRNGKIKGRKFKIERVK